MHEFIFVSSCVFTTVDPETGVISRKEPLETLKRSRVSAVLLSKAFSFTLW